MDNFLNLPLKEEKKGSINPNVVPGREHEYHRFDCCSTEVETLEFLYAFCRLIKPRLVLETGTFKGYGACYLAKALRDNGLPDAHCLSIEWDKDLYTKSLEFIRSTDTDLLNWVTLLEGDSTSFDYRPYVDEGVAFDFVFVDCKYRDQAIQNVIRHSTLVTRDTIFALHDTARGRVGVARGDAFKCPLQTKLFINQTPRGLMLGKIGTESRKDVG
jgi:predicted O-methyltransferase YrrM